MHSVGYSCNANSNGSRAQPDALLGAFCVHNANGRGGFAVQTSDYSCNSSVTKSHTELSRAVGNGKPHQFWCLYDGTSMFEHVPHYAIDGTQRARLRNWSDKLLLYCAALAWFAFAVRRTGSRFVWLVAHCRISDLTVCDSRTLSARLICHLFVELLTPARNQTHLHSKNAHV